MAVAKTFTSEMDPTGDGLALTYVVPASACNLNCGFCFIRQRQEAEVNSLRPKDYVTFLESVAAEFPVRVSGVQGYEPLLDESWPYTFAILKRSAELGIPTSLVTNGILLDKRAADLAALGLGDITVSVDAADSTIHDGLRGTSGAFDQTIMGIRTALKHKSFASRLVVASVLLPHKRHYLDGLPALLANLEVPYFGVTPFIRVRASQLGRMTQDHSSLMSDLELLRQESERAGIRFVVDDELAQFVDVIDGTNKFMIHSLSRPDRLLRLTPSGACSAGLDVLRKVTPATPCWLPGAETPAAFLRRQRIGDDLSALDRPRLCDAA